MPDAKSGVPGVWSFPRCEDCGLVYVAAYGVLLMPQASAGGSLLDIGCRNRRLLTVMRTLGWRVHGIESDCRGAEIARRSSGARIDAELVDAL